LFFNTLNWVSGIGFLYATILVPRNPNTPLAIVASMLPVAAPIVLLVRLVVSEVPAWQLVIGQVIMWGVNIASLFWLRHLLKTNLVAYAPRFKLWPWLRRRLANR
jgi:ABC-type Na+ efflux pump permease subunit